MSKKVSIGQKLSLVGLFLVAINPIFDGEYTLYIRLTASVLFFALLIVVIVQKNSSKVS
jgi:hypothetical protein